jgi:hypothetical protein
VVKKIENEKDAESLWYGRRVKIVDGSSVSMPDTPENQQAYPQPSRQKKGCGFPIMRITALFSLASGAITRFACFFFVQSKIQKLSSFDTIYAP